MKKRICRVLLITLLCALMSGCAQYRASYVKYAADGVTKQAELLTKYNQFLWMGKATELESHTELQGEYSRTLLTKGVESRSDSESIAEIKETLGVVAEAVTGAAVKTVVPVP